MSDSLPDQDREQRWMEAVPIGAAVVAQFLGGAPRPAHRTAAGWESDDGMTGCTPWSLHADETWLSIETAIALADREQAELREEIEDHLSWKNAETARADRAEAEAAGLRERLTRAEDALAKVRALRRNYGAAALAVGYSNIQRQTFLDVGRDLDRALSADENGTRDEH